MSAMHLAPIAGAFAPTSSTLCTRKTSKATFRISRLSPSHPSIGIARGATRSYKQSVKMSSATTYEAPSSVGGATELEALSSFTQVVPDSVLMASENDIPRKAATVSAGVLGEVDTLFTESVK